MGVEATKPQGIALGPIGTAGVEAGMGLVNNVSNLIFGRAIQKQQLKGQKQALEQQNAAALDLWNKTNYGAQVEHLKEAGLNPALIYGMSGGGGASTGGAAPMPQAQSTMPIAQGMGIQMGLLNAQIKVLESQAKKNNAEATKTEGIDTKLGEGQLQKIIAETTNEVAKNELIKLDAEMKKIQNNIADTSQWYHIGKVEQDWLKSIEEYRSAAAKAAVDQATIDTNIKTASAELAIKMLQQKAIKKGMELTDAQMQQIDASIRTFYKDAETNRMNAESNYQNAATGVSRQQHEKFINDVANSTKLTYETVQDVMQAIILKGGIQQARNPIGFK